MKICIHMEDVVCVISLTDEYEVHELESGMGSNLVGDEHRWEDSIKNYNHKQNCLAILCDYSAHF
jgi:hypothetical protein